MNPKSTEKLAHVVEAVLVACISIVLKKKIGDVLKKIRNRHIL